MKKYSAKTKFTRTKTGCLTCRVRKIKCDESHPECINCFNRELQCVWLGERPTPSTPAISERAGITLPPLNLTNLRLLHHVAISTSQTLPHPRIPNTLLLNPKAINVLSVFSQQNSFLVHAILCIGATHLALQTDEAAYYALAQSHFQSAITQTKLHSWTDFTKGGSSDPRFVCNLLLTAYLSATGHIHSQLFFSEIIIMSCRGVVVLARDIIPPKGLPFTISTTALSNLIGSPSAFPTQRLLSLVDTSICIDPEELLGDPLVYSAYQAAVVSLEYTWRTFTDPHYQVTDIVFSRWATTLPARFMTLIHERRQRALIILAYYCAIISSSELWYWHLRDVKRDLIKISALIEMRWVGEMSWPLSVLDHTGRIPSVDKIS